MLSPADFKEKQILFIDARAHKGETAVRFQNDHIVFSKDGKVVNRASCHRALAVFFVGEMSFTSVLLRKGVELGVSFFFLNQNYRTYASLGGDAEGNYLLRMRQYALSEEENFLIAKHIVANKIKNQLRLLGKDARQSDVRRVLEQVRAAKDRAALLGIEGSSSRSFFRRFFHEIGWRRRAPRAKEDIPNLLLDIGYTLLGNFSEALLRTYGFDLYKGVYHQLFFARKSLVVDTVEPFRCLVDRALLKAYRLGRVKEEDFCKTKQGGYALPWNAAPKYYRIFSDAIMERKEDIYAYIQGFYRHVMLPGRHPLREFDVRKYARTSSAFLPTEAAPAKGEKE